MADNKAEFFGANDIGRMLADGLQAMLDADPRLQDFIRIESPYREFTFSGPDVEPMFDLVACVMEFMTSDDGIAERFNDYMDERRPGEPCSCGHPENHVDSVRRHTRKIARDIRNMLEGRA